MAKSKKKASVQKPGKLMLNNPSIPPELDEDIDDDLAFNSDDEKMYGHFFDRSDAKKAHDDSEFPGDDDDFSEDDESYDLADALDESLAQERANLPKTSLKRRRGETQVREGESMYGTAGKGEDGLSGSYSRALASFMTKNKKNEAEESAFQRLEGTLKNKKNTIVMDEDDMTREKVDREQVRNLVQENLSKYKPIIREMSSSKHVAFPLKQANSNPISTTIGSVASSASQAPTKEVGESSMSFAQKVAQRTNSLLSSAGLSGESHASALSSHDTFGDEVPIGGGEEEGEGVPSTGYIAKLKAMLAAESGRRKRFNKIKSKTYRRILRKEKEREKEKKEIAFQLLHPELARKRLSESLMKARAEERVTQKHKNTSAWVKQAKRFAKFDDNAKASIQEQLNIHQRLTQKMETRPATITTTWPTG
ncbi:hypothetical protein AGDE_14550 [Angomonas deanei]|uniref:Utp14 protein, putative n=1 Tax=Angomonas deanei TaxID=59799 RepID=A0A7G2C9B8_9TRYP|nr:hypothetical protein AGDE_14550 [Angomonas deanei]CAD2216440.1 Utp14 protein, putative [Angomonas deanei]|eukprot:EPY20660.1 hypothetical protein AGDE_14550 [Angomonas deanei]